MSARGSDSCNYGLTYNCINHFENQKTFNDGYHIIHHIKSVRSATLGNNTCLLLTRVPLRVRPGLHWTQLPTEFENTLAKHADEGALTFTAHFFEIGLWTFTGTTNARFAALRANLRALLAADASAFAQQGGSTCFASRQCTCCEKARSRECPPLRTSQPASG